MKYGIVGLIITQIAEHKDTLLKGAAVTTGVASAAIVYAVAKKQE